MINKLIAKKSLGQNFLRSEGALCKIVDAGEVKPWDTVLEIGPGEGALTKHLLNKAGLVIAVEKDDRLISILQEKFAPEIKVGKFRLIHGDILEKEISEIVPAGKYKLIANIPYYITGLIVQKFLESDQQPTQMVILVQKEVADRIVARNGKESILSMSVKAYGVPKLIDKVPRGAFHPVPNVDSAILSIKNISKKYFTNNQITEKRFFEILKAGFAHKRKILLGNLKEKYPNRNWPDIFLKLNLSPTVRAENLTLEQWAKLV